MKPEYVQVLESAEALFRRVSLIGDQPCFSNDLFDWVLPLEKATDSIFAEYAQFLEKVSAEKLPNFQDISPEQQTLTTDDKWKILLLMAYGEIGHKTVSCFPRTYDCISQIPGITTCMFSILAPNKHIPSHRGPYAGVLRCHLPLKVPVQNEKCWIRINDEKHHWQCGKALIFDDTYEHEALNDTDEYRIVLFLDFLRPLPEEVDAINKKIMQMFRDTEFVQIPKSRYLEWEEQHLGK